MQQYKLIEWLDKARELSEEMRALQRRIKLYYDKCESLSGTKGTVYSQDKTQVNKTSDPTATTAELIQKYSAKLRDLEEQYNLCGIQIENMKEIIGQAVGEKHISTNQKDAIYYYYFEGMNNREVAAIMSYSPRQIIRYKEAAIKNMSLHVTPKMLIMVV